MYSADCEQQKKFVMLKKMLKKSSDVFADIKIIAIFVPKRECVHTAPEQRKRVFLRGAGRMVRVQKQIVLYIMYSAEEI